MSYGSIEGFMHMIESVHRSFQAPMTSVEWFLVMMCIYSIINCSSKKCCYKFLIYEGSHILIIMIILLFNFFKRSAQLMHCKL